MVKLRSVTEMDLPLIFTARSNPDIYQGFYSQKSPLKWEEHYNWWHSRPSSWKSFIIYLDDESVRPVGLINIGQMEHWSPELGWTLFAVSDWGKGYAKEAVKLAFDYLKSKNYQWCHTTIKMDNERSIHLAWKLGFQVIGGAREGELWLTKELTKDCPI